MQKLINSADDLSAARAGTGERARGAAPQAAVDGVREVGGAKVADRTMVDALAPAAVTFAARLVVLAALL